MTAIKHLETNQIWALNNPRGDDMPLNNSTKTKKISHSILLKKSI